MGKIFEKMKNIFLGEEYEDEDEYEEDDEYDTRERERKDTNVSSFSRYADKRIQNQNVVNINTNVQIGVCMFNPSNIEEASDIVVQIKNRNIAVVNLEAIDEEMAQRIMDFLCGASYALERDIQQISNMIIIISPVNVEMEGELREKLQASGIILNSSWKPERRN